MTVETITRADLRHLISREIHDLEALGQSTGGSTTTLVDLDQLEADENDVFNGAWVGMYGGTGAGQELFITDHVGATGTITFATATDPSNDTDYEIHRKARLAQYNAAIEAAMRATRLQNRVGKIDESTTLTQDKQYSLPSGFAGIHKLTMIEDTSDDAHEVPVPSSNWKLLEGNPSSELYLGNPISGYVLRIEGSAYPTVPSADSDNITLNVEPVVHYASAMMLRQLRDSSWRESMQLFQDAMSRLNVGWPANTRLVEKS